MDTSETNIKMCDCPEIQEGHKWEYGDWLIAEHGVFQIGTACFDYDMSNPKIPPTRSELPIATIQANDVDGSIFTGDLIWLPRQDQLQEMVCYAWKDIHLEVDMKHWRFHLWYAEMQDKAKGSYPFTSMEQLWLAFVMKEKYDKIWNGEEWVKYSP